MGIGMTGLGVVEEATTVRLLAGLIQGRLLAGQTQVLPLANLNQGRRLAQMTHALPSSAEAIRVLPLAEVTLSHPLGDPIQDLHPLLPHPLHLRLLPRLFLPLLQGRVDSPRTEAVTQLEEMVAMSTMEGIRPEVVPWSRS